MKYLFCKCYLMFLITIINIYSNNVLNKVLFLKDMILIGNYISLQQRHTLEDEISSLNFSNKGELLSPKQLSLQTDNKIEQRRNHTDRP